jgi:integrase
VTVTCGRLSLGHIVQEQLGHANIAMTLNLYSPVTSDMQRHAADAFEAKITSAEQ